MGKVFTCLLLLTTITISDAARSSTKYVSCTSKEACIPHFDCPAVTSLTSKGRLTPQEREYLRGKHCNKINKLDYFCCATSDNNVVNTDNKKLLPEAPVCGATLEDKIFGGEDTYIDDYPWIAQILYRRPGRPIGSNCGGSLINERYVITAAHCDILIKQALNYDIVGVRLGEWDTRTNPDCQEFETEVVCNDAHVEIPVAQAISHEGYDPNSKNQYNDIALLKLERDVEFTDWIKPICLPITLNLRSTDYTGHSLDVAGFGKTENETSSPVKKRLEINGVARSNCQVYYTRQGVTLVNSQFCAGGEEGRDSCNGDSGGPLMKYGLFPNSNISYYMLVGIVSFGPKSCGTKDAPGVYTRVSEYMDWIENKIKN